MRYLCLLSGLLFVITACGESAPQDGAIRVTATYGSYTPACLRVTTSDVKGNVGEKHIPRDQFKERSEQKIIVAIFRRPEWERELTVEVASYDASDNGLCSGTLLEKYRSPEFIEVPRGRDPAEFQVQLLANDGDQDGYAQRTEAVAGMDCDDGRPNVRPGQTEACDSTEDLNCDGWRGCSSAECLNQPCSDGNACTLNDLCAPGVGTALECRGTPKPCDPPNLACYTSESACIPETGECVYTSRPSDTACDDNNACTKNDACAADGENVVCKGTAAVQCTPLPPTSCYESEGSCDRATGKCAYTPKQPAAGCDDSNACTQGDACDGSGSCIGQPLPECRPSNECVLSRRNDCPATDRCTESVDPSKLYKACNDAGRRGVCRPDGACSSFPFAPSNFNPDAIPESERGLAVRINCGNLTNPVIFDSSDLSWQGAGGCPSMPVAKIIEGDIVVIPMASLVIDADHALKLRGDRPVILAVYGDATLSGALLADADKEIPGPGGNRLACGLGLQTGGDGSFSNGDGSGAGGGGFGLTGAKGGMNVSNTAGGTAGVAVSSVLDPLIGGCKGGLGGARPGTFNGGIGGAGGGALQVAVAGTLRVEYWISVSGGGGRGGNGSVNSSQDNAGGGGGGGSGGGLLLESFRLELTQQARLTANGGGGAEGGDAANNKRGKDGDDGSESSRDAAAGGDGGGIGAPGGRGGAEGLVAVSGGDGVNRAGGGGGGGAVGVIRLLAFGSCGIDQSCNLTDGNNCDISPRVDPICPPP